jgi:phosphoglycolate phosphatase-like HAD superfamily hydrolase
MSEDAPSPGFRHIFLDAEGTLYVPKAGRTTWEFWADPSPELARRFFVLDDGVVDSLCALRAISDTLCIASRNSQAILDVLLDDFGIRDFFDEIILNGNKGRQIARYLESRGLRRDQAVMVGDTPVLDIYPVRRRGIEAILVDRPYNRWADAERIKGVWELPSWLRIAEIAAEAPGRSYAHTLDDFMEWQLKQPKGSLPAQAVDLSCTQKWVD